MGKLALRFISGKYKGGEYVLPEGREIFIGRSSDIDLVLMEDMVSRKHARLFVQNGKIQLKDLGSTNGTFVNGEKISETTVNRGDRILVGTSIMKVVESEAQAKKTQTGSPVVPQTETGVSRTTIHSSRSMAGTIAEVPLPDLIQLFSTSKKTGTLVVTREDSVIGKIHLEQGRVIYASVSSTPNLKPLKAIFRILAWKDGNFEFVGPEAKRFPETMSMPTEHILMEGLRQLDELKHLEAKLPAMSAELVVVTPLMARLADLKAEELEVFQMIYNYGTVQDVLERSELADADTAAIVLDLIKRSYVAQL